MRRIILYLFPPELPELKRDLTDLKGIERWVDTTAKFPIFSCGTYTVFPIDTK